MRGRFSPRYACDANPMPATRIRAHPWCSAAAARGVLGLRPAIDCACGCAAVVPRGTRDRFRHRRLSGCRRRRGGRVWDWNHEVASRRGFGFLSPLLGWDSCGKRGEKTATRFGLLRARVWGIGGQRSWNPRLNLPDNTV